MNSIEGILYAVLAILIFLVIGLIVAFLMIKKKEQGKAVEKKEVTEVKEQEIKSANSKLTREYSTKSIFDFMEFETVKDSMIVQKGGKRYLMVIECKGINYDLMSEVEKASIEQGFANFLNTIKEPIQIYIQTRTVNLESNILKYEEKVDKLRDDINLKEFRLKEYGARPNINEKVFRDKQFELLREKSLYSYGKDIIADTKRMSLNKNVLKKKYYIIIKYFYEPTDKNDEEIVSSNEIEDMAFSNLSTKAQSVIRTLYGSGIMGKALNSFELVELLYNAYNRDDSEIFGIEKAREAEYNEIYIDSQSVIDRKIEALNKDIQIRAKEKAENAIEKVIDERNKELAEIEDNIDNIIEELAKKMIEENNQNLPENIREAAIEEVGQKKKKTKKGVDEANGKQDTKESSGKRRAS